jgi:DNA-binding NarL/FixJ family response regulator
VTSERPTVVIADDHPPLRGAVRGALEDGGFEVLAEAADAPTAIEAVERHRPDIALLDIHMPGSGISAAAAISRQWPNTAVVMLTASEEDDDLFDSLRAGATGYLLKTVGHDRLPLALRGALSGEAAMPRAQLGRILDEFRSRPPRRFRSDATAKLTPREWEIMEMLEQGASTDEVARRLFVSSTTVRVHVSTVLRKLRVRDRQSAFKLLRGE